MKYVLLLVLVLSMPFVSAYSIGDFVGDFKDFLKGYFGLTGSVILEVTEKSVKIGTENLEEFNPDTSEGSTNGNSCKDSDLINYFEVGLCKDNLNKMQDYCSEDGSMVFEYYCGEKDVCTGAWYVCEGKCVDGMCVAK